MTNAELMRRIRAGEDVEYLLDIRSKEENEDFRAFMIEEAKSNPRAADAMVKYDQTIRDINSGVYGARSTWHSISDAQRRALVFADRHGGKLYLLRYRSDYGYDPAGGIPKLPIRIATLRNLCSRDLMAWDGGAFRPEDVVVVTERGRFVLKHGPAP